MPRHDRSADCDPWRGDVCSSMWQMRDELSYGSNIMRIRSTTLGILAGVVLTSSVAQAALCTRLPLSDVALNRNEATTAARKKLKLYAVEKLTERGWSGDGAVNAQNETVMCTPYFSFGAIKAGFRCLVTATFCVNSQQALRAGAGAPRVTIQNVPVPRPARRPQAKQRPQEIPQPARQTPPPRTASTTKPASARAGVQTRRKAAAPAKKTVKLRLRGSSYEISGVLKTYNKLSYVIAPPDSENITVPADRFDCVSGACPKATN